MNAPRNKIHVARNNWSTPLLENERQMTAHVARNYLSRDDYERKPKGEKKGVSLTSSLKYRIRLYVFCRDHLQKIFLCTTKKCVQV